jgi:predicted  nucleic acid-binding Zn-ribbon protein
MLTLILEAAFRSLLMGVCVWAGIRMLRVHHVLAQKVAWVLVLVAAGVMPLVMRAPFLALDRAIHIPVQALIANRFQKPASAPAKTISTGVIGTVESPVQSAVKPRIAKPRAGHFSQLESELKQQVMDRVAVIAPEMEVRLASGSHLQAAVLTETPIQKSPFWTSAHVASGLAILYLVVAGALFFRTLLGFGIAARIWRRSVPVGDFLSEATEPGLRVRVSRDLATPVTIGSSVILPADYTDWDDAKLRIVLAHEQSHVHQKDFYLQLLAAVHVAVFWFSPLGWWLQRKLSELGEALSDRAGLAQASSAASYAQVLLDFAAMPRPNRFQPHAGVAMARSSNLSSRIERILNDRRFRLAFLGDRRRHAALAAVLVPTALIAAVALIRIGPAAQPVHAAQDTTSSRVAPKPDNPVGTVSADAAPGATTGQIPAEITDQVIVADRAQQDGDHVAPQAPVPAPAPAAVPDVAPAAEPVAPVAPESDIASKRSKTVSIHSGDGFAYRYSDNDGEDSFAIVNSNGNGNQQINFNGGDQRAFARVRASHHGDYIWVQHDGKSYVIDDPAILAQGRELFKSDPRLKKMQEDLEAQQRVLNKRMSEMNSEAVLAQLETPEYKASMARLQKQIADLQGPGMQKMLAEIDLKVKENRKLIEEAARQDSQEVLQERVEKMQELQSERMEKLGDLQGKIGEIQGKIGELQGELGEKRGEWGEKQGQLGEKMGELGEQMGKIGEEQGRKAQEACRKMQSILDQAIRDGKAKPVE